MAEAAYNPFGGQQPQPVQKPQVPTQPAATPEEAEARKSGWMRFFDQIDQDPNVRNTLINFGAQLMQPTMPGDSSSSALARGLSNSVAYLNNLRASQAQSALDSAKTQAEIEATQAGARKTSEEADVVKDKAGATVRAQNAQAENLDQATVRSQATLPSDIAKTEAETKATLTNAESARMNALSSAKNADTNEFAATVQLWKNIEDSEDADLDRALQSRQVDIMAEEVQVKAAQGKLPAADIQRLEWYTQFVTNGDRERAAELMVREDIAKEIAGNTSAVKDTIAESLTNNALIAAGHGPSPEETIPQADQQAIRELFPEGEISYAPNPQGGYYILKDGQKTGKIWKPQ